MGNRPHSIDVLVRRPERHWKNLHFDVAHLIGRGLIARRSDQRVEATLGIVAAEMRLAA